jgi:hypothetical protein
MSMNTWISLCVSKPVVRRSALTALIVGCILVAINHGDALLHGQVDAAFLPGGERGESRRLPEL